jgi:adenine-specific DNA methylase
MPVRKKLIEVALPLEAINKASAREKSIRHGHPSTLHLWWARRPLAAARAVIFAQVALIEAGGRLRRAEQWSFARAIMIEQSLIERGPGRLEFERVAPSPADLLLQACN